MEPATPWDMFLAGLTTLLGVGAAAMIVRGWQSGRETIEVDVPEGAWPARVSAAMAPVAKAAGVPGLVQMAQFQSSSESKGNPLVGLGIPSRFPSWSKPNRKASASLQANESNAAEIGYDRNAASYNKSPYPRSRWVYGSGGLYGLLPSTGLAFLRGKPEIASVAFDPYDLFDPHRSSVAYADYVRRITRLGQWQALPVAERNWLAVKRAGASLTTLSDFTATTDRAKAIHANAAKRLRELGLPESFARQPIPPFAASWDARVQWNALPRITPTGTGV